MARKSLFFMLVVLTMASCKFYKRDLLFKLETAEDSAYLKSVVAAAKVNYKIAPFDWIDVKVYSNGGENLVDPNSEFGKQIGNTASLAARGLTTQGMSITGTSNIGRYLVDANGNATLPLVGVVNLKDKTYHQADSLLGQLYSNFYEDAFVICRTNNRRCIVVTGNANSITNTGTGMGQVVSLPDEGITIVEAIALAGGLPIYTDVRKIKIIRGGNLAKPVIEEVSLRNVKDLPKSDLRVFPNDIIYLEPARRPFIDLMRDLTPIITIPLSAATIIIYLLRR